MCPLCPRRPQELFEIDLAELEKVATQIDKGDEQRRDFKGIYAECAAVLRQVCRHRTTSVPCARQLACNGLRHTASASVC